MLGFKAFSNYVELCLDQKSKNYDLNFYNDFYEKYFKSPIELLKKNKIYMSDIKKNIDNTSIENVVHMITKNNPLALFSECTAEDCPLNRHNNVGKYYKSFFENKVVDEIINHNKKDNLIYASYFPGFFFPDLMILTKLRNQYKTMAIHLVGTHYDEYCSIIENDDINLIAKKGLIDNYLMDDNIQRKRYMEMTTFRFVKLIEWLEVCGCKVTIRIYRSNNAMIEECKNKASQVDVYIGVDYVDQFPNTICEFQKMAICCTKNNGIIASLRTDGISYFNDSKCHLQIKYNKNPEQSIDYVQENTLQLDNLRNKIKENKIKIHECANCVAKYDGQIVDNRGNIYTEKIDEKGNKIIIFNELKYDNVSAKTTAISNASILDINQHTISVWKTDKYDQFKNNLKTNLNCYHNDINKKFKDLNSLYDLHGSIGFICILFKNTLSNFYSYILKPYFLEPHFLIQ